MVGTLSPRTMSSGGPAQRHLRGALCSWHDFSGKQKAIIDFHRADLTHEKHLSPENSSGASQSPVFTAWAERSWWPLQVHIRVVELEAMALAEPKRTTQGDPHAIRWLFCYRLCPLCPGHVPQQGPAVTRSGWPEELHAGSPHSVPGSHAPCPLQTGGRRQRKGCSPTTPHLSG